MPTTEAEFPDKGSMSVHWSVSVIGGDRRMSWTFSSDPTLDPRLAIAMLRDVAAELEEDLPNS